MDKNFDILEQAIQNLSQGQTPEGPSDELIRRTLERVEQVNTKPNPFVERILKMKPISKFAAAAIVVVSISLLFLFNSGPQSVALADVYSKVQQVQAFMYKMSMNMTGMGEMMGSQEINGPMTSEATVVLSRQYGMKMTNRMVVPGPNGSTQNLTQLVYMLPEQKVMVSITPEQKVYQTIEFTDDLLEQAQKQNNDPRESIRRMMNCEYVSLGLSEIDGKRVQGFETTDPEYSGGIGEVRAAIWVDVETWLPVRSEIQGTVGSMSIQTVVDGYEWDFPVSAADFEYVIPEDYQDHGTVKMPEMTADAAIEGLRVYARVFGHYPERIDMASLVPTLMKNLKQMIQNPRTEAARSLAEKMRAADASGDRTAANELQQEFAPVSGLAVFHLKLTQEKKDLAYYGDRATPADEDAVLMRWRLDSGKYMVIFGDLSSVEMEYEDMIKIEPPVEAQGSTVQ